MEDKWRWILVAAIAPVLWGANYYVTQEFLPAESPLWGSVLRALPAGLVLLLVVRRLPTGAWWWRSAVLGALTVGAFFTLVYIAAQRLPSSIASTLMATSAAAMIVIAWFVLAERPRITAIAGAAIGITGVAVMLLGGATSVDPVGVAASLAAMVLASIGFALTKRWAGDESILAITSWQLTAGGLVLIPAAIIVEGSFPQLSPATMTTFAYVALVATAVAYATWFTALRHLRAGTIGIVGLLNPVTGVLIGAFVAAEALTFRQVTGILLVLAGVVLGQHHRSGGAQPAPLPPGEALAIGTTGLLGSERVEGTTGHDLLTGDHAFGPSSTHEGDGPVQQRGHSLLEADQVEQVHEQPQQPAEEAGHPESADAGHRREAGDRGHVALVVVGEVAGLGTSAGPSRDHLGGVLARLHGDLGDPRQVGAHHVADHEHLGEAGQ